MYVVALALVRWTGSGWEPVYIDPSSEMRTAVPDKDAFVRALRKRRDRPMASTCVCQKCGHEWKPRCAKGILPAECPRCKSRTWNQARQMLQVRGPQPQ